MNRLSKTEENKMIYRISGDFIPETFNECQQERCEKCVYVSYVCRIRVQGLMMIDCSTCQTRNLLVIMRETADMYEKPALLRGFLQIAKLAKEADTKVDRKSARWLAILGGRRGMIH